MKVTLKLNWNSVCLANCLSTCWRIIKIQSRARDAISAADKMRSDTSLLGDLWFLLLLVLEGSASAATVCVTFIPLSLSLSLQCLSKNINKTPWRECQQDASRGGDTWVQGEQRGRETERGEENIYNISIPKQQGNVGAEWEVIYILSHAESSFTPPLDAGAGHLIGPLAVADRGLLADPHRPLPRDCNSKLAMPHL